MNALAQSVLEALRAADPPAELLAEAGDPEPARATAAIAEAFGIPNLAAQAERWIPAILGTARPGFAAQQLCELSSRFGGATHRELDLARCPRLPQVLGSSDFLARLLLRHPHWVDEIVGELPEAPRSEPIEPDFTAIRIEKYKGLLRIAARDLAGREFPQSLAELSQLADRCLAASLASTEETLGIAEPSLMALGKLGGSELNFSSDVDLLLLHPDDDPPERADADRFIQHFKKHLEAPSEDGFGYRVDLDLRPQGKLGALSYSPELALDYYETIGADWERQMLIRLRHVAGPEPAAREFLRGVMPFVYRQLIDPQAILSVRDMKLRVEAERRTSGRDLEVELKDGPGGIRDVEFLTQAFQMLYGGRHPKLRTGNVLLALQSFEELGLLPAAVTESLRDSYLWLRRAEHALQMIEERQTQRFPREPIAQTGLARRMGYADESGAKARGRLLEDWTHVRAEVRAHFNALILEAPDDARP